MMNKGLEVIEAFGNPEFGGFSVCGGLFRRGSM